MTILWRKSTEYYNNPDNSEWPVCCFGNSKTGQFGYIPGPGRFTARPGFVWGLFQDIDFTVFDVAADANYVDIGGIGIITGGAELCIAFRAPDGEYSEVPDWTYYQEQLLSTSPTDGERTVVFDKVPLIQGRTQMAVMAKFYPDNGGIPGPSSAASVGWNLKVKGWGR